MNADTDWVRAHELKQFQGKTPQLFEGKIEPNDLCQGAVGDCWYAVTKIEIFASCIQLAHHVFCSFYCTGWWRHLPVRVSSDPVNCSFCLKTVKMAFLSKRDRPPLLSIDRRISRHDSAHVFNERIQSPWVVQDSYLQSTIGEMGGGYGRRSDSLQKGNQITTLYETQWQ